MLIQGPLRFSVAQEELSSGYELFVDFQPDFCTLPLEQQGSSFRSYLAELSQLVRDAELQAQAPNQTPGQTPDQAQQQRNLQGLLIVQQIAEQLLPYIESGDLDLTETINIHVRPESPEVSLINLLRHSQLG